MSTGVTSRVLSPTSIASSFHYVTASDRHSEVNSSSDESFGSISDATSSDEDDEIVWSVSDLSASGSSRLQPLRSPGVLSDDEYIVLSPPLSQPPQSLSGLSSLSASFIEDAVESSSIDGLSDVMSNLNIAESDAESARPTSQASSRRRRRRSGRAPAATVTTGVATAIPVPPTAVATPKPKKKKTQKKANTT